jgi:cbb3-type cytochrome oxidase subunit 3
MFKEVVQAMNSGILAQIGLFAFLLAFILVMIRVFLLPKKERDEAKQQPLNDPPEIDPSKI